MLTRSAPVSPYALRRINAGSAIVIPYQSVDDALNPVELATDGLRYRIDNLTDSVVIQDWVTVTGSPPAQRGTITIPASLNAMSRQYRDRQLNQVALEFTDSDGNVTQVLAHYEIAAVFVGTTG
jgi:hypothetical protein